MSGGSFQPHVMRNCGSLSQTPLPPPPPPPPTSIPDLLLSALSRYARPPNQDISACLLNCCKAVFFLRRLCFLFWHLLHLRPNTVPTPPIPRHSLPSPTKFQSLRGWNEGALKRENRWCRCLNGTFLLLLPQRSGPDIPSPLRLGHCWGPGVGGSKRDSAGR